MYFRTKRSGGFEYLQMVESHRVNGKPRQTVVATLGRLDALKQTGELDRLLRSGARLTETGMLLSAFEKGETTTIDAKRIGPPLLFERLWRDSACRSVIENLLADRKFEFPARARRVSDRAASDHGSGLGSRRGEVAIRLFHRRHGRDRPASSVPGDGLARRGTCRPTGQRPGAPHQQGSDRGATVRQTPQPLQ